MPRINEVFLNRGHVATAHVWHVWAEFLAHLVDDKDTPFVEINHDRNMIHNTDVTGIKHKDGRWILVEVSTYTIESIVEGDKARMNAAVYEVFKNAFLDALIEHKVWPERVWWIEQWEWQVGMRRDRPKKLKKRRMQIRRGN